MFGKYSVNNLVSEFQQNRHKIHAYVTGNCVECYSDNGDDEKTIMGLGIGLFLVVFVIALGIWIWALVALLQNWNNLSDVAKILAVLALIGILGGPVVTLIIVYVMRNGSGNGKRSSVEVPMKDLGRGSPKSGFKYKMMGRRR